MLLNLLNPHKIKASFPRFLYQKGQDYYRKGRVKNINLITKSNGSIIINASVKGSQTYHVMITVQGPANKIRINSTCSCPMQMNCKHVIATLLKALNEPSSTNDNAKITQPSFIKQNPQINNWLKQMQHSLNIENEPIDATDESYSLFYLLSTPEHQSTELQLELALVRRLKSGGLGAPKAFNRSADSHQKHLYPVDRELELKLEIAKKLSSHYSYSRTYSLNNERTEKLLPELIATGRCCWLKPQNPPLILTSAQQAEIDWQIDDEGCQILQYKIAGKSCRVFSIDQLWYLDEEERSLGPLETGLNKQLAKSLLSAPKIPPEQTKVVVDLLTQHTGTAHIKQPIVFTETKVARIKPIPHLSLFQTSLKMIGNQKSYWQPIQVKKPLAKLVFDYQGVQVPWEDKRDTVNLIKDRQLTQMFRNEKAEANAIDMLIDHNAVMLNITSEFAISNENFSFCFLIDNEDCDPLEFSIQALPKLRAAGWRVEIADDYPYQIVDDPIDEWYSSIDESSGYDWFGFEMGIMLKGEKINLLPVLQKLLQKLQGNQQIDITGSEPVFAQLADGRYIQLPAERVRNILKILIELYDHDSLTDEKMLRLSKLHAARLLELEAALGAVQLRWFGGETIRKLGAKLTHFKGIEIAKVPQQFKGELRPYQQEGLSWLQFLREYELGGVLADDMGLGKTVQALSHLTLEKTSGRMKLPSLIVAPTSLMFNWRLETERFSPDLKLLILHGADRKQQFSNIADHDIILTTYPLLVRDKEILLKQHFYLIILDEAQFIKNTKSLMTQVALQIKASHRICLTGTPMENHLGELWSLFHFMMPGLLGDEKSFNRVFRTPIEKHSNQERRLHLNRRIAPFLLRRTKDKVVKELPSKVEMLRHVELEGAQRDLYETIRITMQEKVRKEIAKLGLSRSHIIILDALLKLRQICCDPRLLKIATPKKKLLKSAKLELLMTLLAELLGEGRRILLFSQFTQMLELIEAELNKKKITYVKLTGQTKDRMTPVQQFQNGEVPLFLISLKAGGTGLNLTAADTVIHYDPWWNPAVENQATDRAHRIGQTKTVFVYKFVTKGTVEEKILEMQQHKHALMEGLFSDKTTSKLKLSEKDLQSLFDPLEAVN
jgi:SNF2 family DNA or RNA helicase